MSDPHDPAGLPGSASASAPGGALFFPAHGGLLAGCLPFGPGHSAQTRGAARGWGVWGVRGQLLAFERTNVI